MLEEGVEKMAISIEELNEFITTDQGKAWLEEQKASLLDNRDSILSELKKARGEYSELKQRFEETESTLMAEKAVTSKYLIDNELTSLLRKAFVFEDIIPRVINNLKTAHSLTVKTDSDNRTVVGMLKDDNGNDVESTLTAIVDAWKQEPESKYFIKNVNSGSGATGGFIGRYGSISPSFNNISGQALAKMSDQEFSNFRDHLQTKGENK